jgi:histidinol-phosphatase (PHP family)
MRPPDNHVHTEWSWDTADSASMISACTQAVAEGLPAIAFTEHLDFTVWHAEDRATTSGMRGRHPGQQLPIDVEGYFADIAECRERFPELRIWSGIEAGEPHLFAASLGRHLERSPVDRILGSLHSLELNGQLVGVTRLLWSDADGTMRRYLAEVVDMIESSDVFQVLAHVDFPRRYWPGGTDRFVEKDFEEEYRAVFRALAGTGRALEVNTSSPLASADLVRWFREEGGEAVSFGSDAHQPRSVGQRFDLAVDVVEAAGFRPGRDRFDFWRR